MRRTHACPFRYKVLNLQQGCHFLTWQYKAHVARIMDLARPYTYPAYQLHTLYSHASTFLLLLDRVRPSDYQSHKGCIDADLPQLLRIPYRFLSRTRVRRNIKAQEYMQFLILPRDLSTLRKFCWIYPISLNLFWQVDLPQLKILAHMTGCGLERLWDEPKQQ